jgi:hypothetical protein
MQLRHLVLAFCASAVAACSSTPDHPSAPRSSADEASAGMPTIASVTKRHRVLERKAGQWTARVKDPSGRYTDATYEASIGCGGLWLIGDYRGEFAGTSFSGHEVLGYDAQKALYVASWFDSWTDHAMELEGTFDEATNTLTQWTQGHDPVTGKSIRERHDTHFVDANHFTYTMSGPDEDGVYTPFMTISYSRKK